MNPYEVLEIAAGASPDEIKAAYHGMAKKWHPDRYTGAAKVEAEQRFRMLAEAYNMIKDTPAREERTAPGLAPAPPSAPAQIQLDHAPEMRAGTNKSAEEWFRDAKAAAEAKAPERALGLIQYAIRLDSEHAEFHALHAKLLDQTKGDKRTLVRALETALRLDPKDVDSSILLAETFQGLGMHARASRLWNTVHNLAPNHPIFSPVKIKGKNSEKPGLGEQWNTLVATTKDAINRLLKRG
ncbi:MAG: DnaJ domain-containing protein [Holophaga sp.]|nr:DnaJ domain-containing protein [Holophaga sp.]